jgi:hypothetical protein
MNVGGFTRTQRQTVATTNGAYATGQVMGGLLTFTDQGRNEGGSGLLNYIQAWDHGNTGGAFDLYVFRGKPSASTVQADKQAASFADADLELCIGWESFGTADWHAPDGNHKMAKKSNLGWDYDLGTGRELYGICVARGNQNYAGASKVVIRLGNLQD